MKQFVERMFYAPRWYHWIVGILLLPLSIVYGLGMWLRRVVTRRKDFGVPILSVGNLIVGGAGKTPFVITLALQLEGVAVISRGYGRQSRGLIEVSHKGKLLVGVEEAGDEPYLMAESLPNASVIVSENRHEAITLAKANGCCVIILDDGFNRVEIAKYEILLEPVSIPNCLPFPSGPFREFWFMRQGANLVCREGEAFERQVVIDNTTERMVLITAIANPERLTPFLPQNLVAKVYLEDHAYFDLDMVRQTLERYQATSILCTSKDRVKLEKMGFPLSEMQLTLVLNHGILPKIQHYIKGYESEK